MDFIKSLQAGLEAEKKAEENRNKIKQLFDQLSSDVYGATNGKVKVNIALSKMQLLEQMVVGLGEVGAHAIHLISSAKDDQKPFLLALYKTNMNGFPVKIAFEGKVFSCDDIDSLSNVLSQRLESSIVGRAVSNLMK